MKILIAVDPAHRDAPVLSFASSLADAVPSDLSTISAYVSSQAEMDPVYQKELMHEVATLLSERLDSASLVVPEDSRILREDEAAEAILDAVERQQPDLVLLGARGTGGFRGLGLGGVAHRVATHLSLPMAVVPANGGPLPGGVLVCGVDGSKGSRAALRWSVDLAAQCGASVVAVFVYDELADTFTHTAANWEYNGEASARAVVTSVDPDGVPIAFERRGGHPVKALSEVAERHQAAAIVVASNRHFMLRSHALGRVPAQLLHHAHRPVVVVHG